MTGTSAAVAGSDNLTETVMAPGRIDVIQYKKVQFLKSSSYSAVKNSTKARSNFRIIITDTATNATHLDYGDEDPRRGNVVALEKFLLFQNSTGGIRLG